MSLTIWKQQLTLSRRQTISVPRGSTFLTAREQGGKPCVWFKCDPKRNHDEQRDILLVGTGQEAPEMWDGKYLGTASLAEGTLILHVFEALK